ncbi:MAG TPA: protein-L-isoaspartate(D-aspartate) O-methyltransferase [Bacteroidales bacterium]|nr:protein-L-isoaspartate(D-aspartate) O-methyltransferase [Bacteroidales bacterium]HPO66094.1 protein-L-isoaspartate(D-aspartate) O-methyltransferase [Bacteroidales bacterium]
MRLFQIFCAFIIVAGMDCSSSQENDYVRWREQMVSDQIISRGIKDKKVIAAMRKVERHRFVPDEYKQVAYGDHPLPIGYEQTISQPYVVAFMTEALELKQTDRVLEIGTGSGYQAAILAEICDSVFTIEIVPELAQQAKLLLEQLGYKNIQVKHGDGYQGWIEKAPFDAIIVTCSPTKIPQPLKDQLREGGRMIIPVGYSQTDQYLYLIKKQNGRLVEKAVLPVRFVPMVNFEKKSY